MQRKSLKASQIIIKKAAISDIPRICQFLKIMGEDFPASDLKILNTTSYIHVFLLLTKNILFNKIRVKFTGYFFETFIALSEDSVVGISYFGASKNIATLQGIVVEKKFREQKIGYNLLIALLNSCHSRKIGLIQLYVLKNSAPAISLYESMGFMFSGVASDNNLYICMEKRF